MYVRSRYNRQSLAQPKPRAGVETGAARHSGIFLQHGRFTMSDVSLSVGSVICFLYPHANDKGVSRKRMEPRRILIVDVRDLHERPLDPITAESNPGVDRGRFLVTGWCFDRQAERSFYLNAMEETEPFDPPKEMRIPLIRDGAIIHVATIPEPRRGFVKCYNELSTDCRAVA